MLHVLVVEDSPVERRLTANRVEKAGFSSFTVEAAHEAADAGAADVALLDLGLGRTDGLTSVDVLRRTRPDLPIVVLTSQDDDQQAVAALRAGAHDYLVKHELNIGSLRRSLLLAVERAKPDQDTASILEHIRDHPSCIVMLFDRPHEQVLKDAERAGIATDQARLIDMTQRTECPVLSHDGITLIGSPVQLERAAVHALQAHRLTPAPIVIDSPHMLTTYAGERQAQDFLDLLARHTDNAVVVPST